MFSSVQPLSKFTPDYVKEQLLKGTFTEACTQAKLIALTDWTLYPHMTACWRLMREQVFSKLTHHPFFFFDLVDPSGRSQEDIRAMLKELSAFSQNGRVTLGLNQNEANILCRCLDLEESEPTSQAQGIQHTLGIQEVVIHAHKFAVLAGENERARAEGPYCPTPKKSTGAGDRFNAGYALGLLLDLPPEDRLLLGCASSGLYVRLGKSPTLNEFITFLENRPANPR
jgi:sugar/nucleoside kinase (ribokinase family)